MAPEYMADRRRRTQEAERRTSRQAEVGAHFVKTSGARVLAGPFEGLTYPDGDLNYVDALIPKLLGTYEQELHPIVREAAAAKPEHFVDLGCAEGYYAVGFSRLSPATRVHAYDFAPSARAACAALAEANGRSGFVNQHSKADLLTIPDKLLEGCFLLCDIEGAELGVFESAVVARLAGSLVVVELHEQYAPGVTEVLRQRFAASHRTEVITAAYPRPIAEPAFLDHFSPEDVPELTHEGRRSASWLVGRPH